jgi:hypothetical protein
MNERWHGRPAMVFTSEKDAQEAMKEEAEVCGCPLPMRTTSDKCEWCQRTTKGRAS